MTLLFRRCQSLRHTGIFLLTCVPLGFHEFIVVFIIKPRSGRCSPITLPLLLTCPHHDQVGCMAWLGGTVTRNERNIRGIVKCQGFHGPFNHTSSFTDVQRCYDMLSYGVEPCSPTNLTGLDVLWCSSTMAWQPRPVWNSVGWRQGPRLFWSASWKLWAPWQPRRDAEVREVYVVIVTDLCIIVKAFTCISEHLHLHHDKLRALSWLQNQLNSLRIFEMFDSEPPGWNFPGWQACFVMPRLSTWLFSWPAGGLMLWYIVTWACFCSTISCRLLRESRTATGLKSCYRRGLSWIPKMQNMEIVWNCMKLFHIAWWLSQRFGVTVLRSCVFVMVLLWRCISYTVGNTHGQICLHWCHSVIHFKLVEAVECFLRLWYPLVSPNRDYEP